MSAVIINLGNSDSAGADILDSYPKSPAFVDEEVDSVSRLLWLADYCDAVFVV